MGLFHIAGEKFSSLSHVSQQVLRSASPLRRNPPGGEASRWAAGQIPRSANWRTSGQAPLEIAVPWSSFRREGRPCRPRRFLTGQAALSFIILVSGIIIEIAIAGSFVTYFLSASGLGERLSYRALAVAEAGVRDAQLKIARDKDFVSVGSYIFSLSVGSDVASVAVSRAGSGTYTYTVDSTGVASTRERKLTAMIIVDATSGLAQLQSVAEEPL